MPRVIAAVSVDGANLMLTQHKYNQNSPDTNMREVLVLFSAVVHCTPYLPVCVRSVRRAPRIQRHEAVLSLPEGRRNVPVGQRSQSLHEGTADLREVRAHSQTLSHHPLCMERTTCPGNRGAEFYLSCAFDRLHISSDVLNGPNIPAGSCRLYFRLLSVLTVARRQNGSARRYKV